MANAILPVNKMPWPDVSYLTPCEGEPDYTVAPSATIAARNLSA